MRPTGMTIFPRLVLLVSFLLAGCSVASGASLAGHAFLSTAVMADGQPYTLVPGTRIRLDFSDGQLGASAGCNTMGGTYRIADGRLRVGQLSMTEMGCDPARHAQDEWLSTFLGSGPALTVSGSDLRLETTGGAITLVDREVTDPDLSLVGTTWRVLSIRYGDAVSSVEAGVEANLTFQADGGVIIESSCNSGTGQFHTIVDELRFSEVVLTKRACPAPRGEMEVAMLQVLRAETVSYRIAADSLTLDASDLGLQLSGR